MSQSQQSVSSSGAPSTCITIGLTPGIPAAKFYMPNLYLL